MPPTTIDLVERSHPEMNEMDKPASRRHFLRSAGTAAGGAVALGMGAAPAAAASQSPQTTQAVPMSKGARLRALLRNPGLLIAPEAYTVIAGKLVEARGFDVIYIGGNMMSMTYLGAPDWGVISPTDMVDIAGRIARDRLGRDRIVDEA